MFKYGQVVGWPNYYFGAGDHSFGHKKIDNPWARKDTKPDTHACSGSPVWLGPRGNGGITVVLKNDNIYNN